jgi:hypothetical protein
VVVFDIRFRFPPQAHDVREVVAAERKRCTILQRHSGFAQPFSVYECAVRAAEILDERHARLHENMRVPS